MPYCHLKQFCLLLSVCTCYTSDFRMYLSSNSEFWLFLTQTQISKSGAHCFKIYINTEVKIWVQQHVSHISTELVTWQECLPSDMHNCWYTERACHDKRHDTHLLTADCPPCIYTCSHTYAHVTYLLIFIGHMRWSFWISLCFTLFCEESGNKLAWILC